MFLQALQFLTALNHPVETALLDNLWQIEKEMNDLNREDDVCTKLQWSLYRHILQGEDDINVEMTKILYDLSPNA